MAKTPRQSPSPTPRERGLFKAAQPLHEEATSISALIGAGTISHRSFRTAVHTKLLWQILGKQRTNLQRTFFKMQRTFLGFVQRTFLSRRGHLKSTQRTCRGHLKPYGQGSAEDLQRTLIHLGKLPSRLCLFLKSIYIYIYIYRTPLRTPLRTPYRTPFGSACTAARGRGGKREGV